MITDSSLTYVLNALKPIFGPQINPASSVYERFFANLVFIAFALYISYHGIEYIFSCYYPFSPIDVSKIFAFNRFSIIFLIYSVARSVLFSFILSLSMTLVYKGTLRQFLSNCLIFINYTIKLEYIYLILTSIVMSNIFCISVNPQHNSIYIYIISFIYVMFVFYSVYFYFIKPIGQFYQDKYAHRYKSRILYYLIWLILMIFWVFIGMYQSASTDSLFYLNNKYF